jgi:hypothetical protein
MYEIKPGQRELFAGIYLLDHMVGKPTSIPIFLEGNDQDLEPVLEWLLTHGHVEILNEEAYVPSAKGRDLHKKFGQRYRDYLTNYDLYCAVDLAAGEFAFARYHDIEDEDEWDTYLEDPRWEDLRVPVAAQKGLDPIEIVFMSFLNECRFGRDTSGWQFDLLLGSVWDEILNICNTAIKTEALGWCDDQGEVPGETVLNDIIAQGTALIEDLHLHEEFNTHPQDNAWQQSWN